LGVPIPERVVKDPGADHTHSKGTYQEWSPSPAPTGMRHVPHPDRAGDEEQPVSF